MKKLAMISAVALLGAIVLPSCKKDYTCTCTVAGVKTPTSYGKTTKKDAKAACDALDAALQGNGDCTLD